MLRDVHREIKVYDLGVFRFLSPFRLPVVVGICHRMSANLTVLATNVKEELRGCLGMREQETVQRFA